MEKPETPVSRKARVLVLDDHPLMCEALQQLLGRQEDMKVSACAQTVAEAEAVLERHKIDLMLVDLRLRGGGDTLEFIKSVRARYPTVRMLVLSDCDEMLYADRCLRAGADGYLTKQEACTEVVAAIRTVLRGEMYLSRKVAVLVFQQAMRPPKDSPRTSIATLTDRQLHVFQLLGAGLGSRDIAAQMKVSIKTVESHREHIKQKIGARDSVELVRMATEWVSGRQDA